MESAGPALFWLGRVPEAIDYLESNSKSCIYAHAAAAAPPKPVGRMGTFDRETDIAWDTAGNIFVSDGYGNSRVVKISPDGHWLKAVGTYGSGRTSSTRRMPSRWTPEQCLCRRPRKLPHPGL